MCQWLGTFKAAGEVAMAFDQAASKFHGHGALLNSPEHASYVAGHEADPKHVSRSTGICSGNKRRTNYRGVKKTPSGKWHAQIHDPNKHATVALGTFETVEAAAMAFDEATLKFHGHRALLNIPEHTSYVISHEADTQPVSHSTGICSGNKRITNYRGVKKTASGKWHAQIHDPNKHATVGLGTFESAETAAMVFDEAALKLHGQEARLNFPNRKANPHVSYAQSAELLSSGEKTPSKRMRVSQSLPGSTSAQQCEEQECQNRHQSVRSSLRNPVSSQEQTKNMQETSTASQFVDGSRSGLDVGSVSQSNFSSQQSGEAFHPTRGQDYVLSSSWSDVSELDNYFERDRAMSSMIAALHEIIERNFSDRAPCSTEFPCVKITIPDIVEAERNSGDYSPHRTVFSVSEEQQDPSSIISTATGGPKTSSG